MFILALFAIMFIVTTGIFAYLKEKANSEDSYMTTLPTVRRWVYRVEIAVFVVSMLLSSFFMTTDRQTGFVETFGHVQMIDTSGPHFKLPFIAEKHIYDSTVKSRAIGYDETTEETTGEMVMITADYNIVSSDFNYQYQITNPVEYCYGSDNPEAILRNAIVSAIRGNIGLVSIDSVMTTGKAAIEAAIYEDVVAVLESYHTGISLVNVTFQDSEPPTPEVKKAFDDVEAARQKAEIKRNEAAGYEKSKLPEAKGNASKVISEASAYQTERINQAAEEVAQFNALYSQYQHNPDVVKQVLYYQTVQEILPRMKVVIGEGSVVLVNGAEITLSANADE